MSPTAQYGFTILCGCKKAHSKPEHRYNQVEYRAKEIWLLRN